MLCAFAALACLLSLPAMSAQERYDYDALGRLIRVVDESGEDYAFAANRFHSLDVPLAVQKVLRSMRA